jgi:hypothetical protein
MRWWARIVFWYYLLLIVKMDFQNKMLSSLVTFIKVGKFRHFDESLCGKKLENTNWRVVFEVSQKMKIWRILKFGLIFLSSNFFYHFGSLDMYCYFLFYVFSILWCSQIDDCQHKDLVKFGYRSNMRVKKGLRILLHFGYMLEPIVKSWWFELFFQNMAS